MSGREYLEDIRAELDSGRRQWRMGENLLRAFGYVRRRGTAIDEINSTLEDLGLVADPPVSSDMPLKVPRIHFSLRVQAATDTDASSATPNGSVSDPVSEDTEDDDISLPEPAFSVSELASAKTDVKCVRPGDSIRKAYTKMLLGKFSQLVVANHENPRRQDIKGIVSFQSIAKALMNGDPKTVGDCLDTNVPFAQSHDDLKSVVTQLSINDVVLVIGRDNRLQGIVTAWDLAEEFAELVDPFKRIEEIEERLRTLVRIRLGTDKVAEFLMDHGFSGKDPVAELEELTMGELERVLQFPDHWTELQLPFDRVEFTDALAEARGYRNRLMHFRDPLTEVELATLTNFCETVREIQLH